MGQIQSGMARKVSSQLTCNKGSPSAWRLRGTACQWRSRIVRRNQPPRCRASAGGDNVSTNDLVAEYRQGRATHTSRMCHPFQRLRVLNKSGWALAFSTVRLLRRLHSTVDCSTRSLSGAPLGSVWMQMCPVRLFPASNASRLSLGRATARTKEFYVNRIRVVTGSSTNNVADRPVYWTLHRT